MTATGSAVPKDLNASGLDMREDVLNNREDRKEVMCMKKETGKSNTKLEESHGRLVTGGNQRYISSLCVCVCVNDCECVSVHVRECV